MLAALSACQSAGGAAPAGQAVGETVSVSGGSYRNISAAELRAMLARKDFFLVDVHVPNEGHLKETDARIPYDKIEGNVSSLPADKEARIVLYCRSGRMSQIAAEKLVQLGFRNIWNLETGMVGWQEAGYPLEPN